MSVTIVPQDKYALIGLGETKRNNAFRKKGERNKPIDIGVDDMRSQRKDSKMEDGRERYKHIVGAAVNIFYEEAHRDVSGRSETTAVWELEGQVWTSVVWWAYRFNVDRDWNRSTAMCSVEKCSFESCTQNWNLWSELKRLARNTHVLLLCTHSKTAITPFRNDFTSIGQRVMQTVIGTTSK